MIACKTPTADELIAALPEYDHILKRVFWVRRIANRADREDLRQQTLLIVIRKIRTHGLVRPDLLAEYLHKTAWNVSTIYYRRRRRALAVFVAEQVHETDGEQLPDKMPEHSSPDHDSPEEGAEHYMLARRIDEALSRLLPRDSEVLKRVFLNDEPRERIRRSLHLDEKPFNTVVHRAKARLAVMAAALREEVL